MDKDNQSLNSRLLIRNYSLENVPQSSPGRKFLNPSEIYVLKFKTDGVREFFLWSYFDGSSDSGEILDRPHVKVSSLTLQPDETVNAAELIRVLKGSASQDAPTISKRIVPANLNRDRIVCRYLSNDELLALFQKVIGGKLEISEIIVTEATAVPVDSDEKIIEASSLIADAAENLSSSADFPVNGPSGKPSSPSATETRKRTLQEIEDENEPEYVPGHENRHSRRPNYWILALLAVIALTVGWAVVSFLPSLLPESDYAKGEEMVVADQQLETPVQALPEQDIAPADSISLTSVSEEESDTPEQQPAEIQPEPVATADPDELADLEYLNSNRVWKKSALKSQKYRDFFDLLSTGKITEIAESDYFAVQGNMTNPTAEKVIGLLWGSLTTGTQSANEKQLRLLKGRSEIDLWKLYETLSKYRDKSTNPNPRPKR